MKTHEAHVRSGPLWQLLLALFSRTAGHRQASSVHPLLSPPPPGRTAVRAPPGGQSFQRQLNNGETREGPVREQGRKVPIIL